MSENLTYDFTRASVRSQKWAKKHVCTKNGAKFVYLDMPEEQRSSASSVLYMHLNRETLRCYIGITIMRASLRWAGGDAYRMNRRFGKAIRDYEWGNFDSHILGFFDDRESMNEAERAAIKAAGGHLSKFTYNLSPGGGVVADNSKPIVGVHLPTGVSQSFGSGSEAARELGLPHPDQPMAVARGERTCVGDWWFRFASEVNREPPFFWGEEYRLKRIAESKRRPVIAIHYETKERRDFGSVGEAARNLGVHQSTVSEVASGASHSVKGWFVYYEDSPRQMPCKYGTAAIREKRDRTVYATHFETGEKLSFRNATVAASKIGLSAQSEVSAVLTGRRASAGGWWFSYDPDEPVPPLFGGQLVAKIRSEPVFAKNLKTGEVTWYPSAKSASQATGVARSSISKIVNGSKISAKGYTFNRV